MCGPRKIIKAASQQKRRLQVDGTGTAALYVRRPLRLTTCSPSRPCSRVRTATECWTTPCDVASDERGSDPRAALISVDVVRATAPLEPSRRVSGILSARRALPRHIGAVQTTVVPASVEGQRLADDADRGRSNMAMRSRSSSRPVLTKCVGSRSRGASSLPSGISSCLGTAPRTVRFLEEAE